MGERSGGGAVWEAARKELLANVQEQDYRITDKACVSYRNNGREHYLPAYIPCIGRQYFQTRPRILCYAINQNLSRHARWADEWMARWTENEAFAIDRLNRAAEEGQPIAIKPYVEGFIPLVALIAMQKWQRKHGGVLPDRIDDGVAVTNFVKFSTSADAASSGIPTAWWRECAKRYAVREIKILKPDVILAFGRKTFDEIETVLDGTYAAGRPQVVCCRFPARIASVKGRPLSGKEQAIWDEEIGGLVGRVKRPPDEYYHRCKIEQYPGYFIDVARAMVL